MPVAGPIHIRHTIHDGQLFLAIDGAATYQASLAVEEITRDYLDRRPARPTVAVDLEQSRFIDSTFTGWMIRLRQKLLNEQGRLILSRCPTPCRRSLQTMGVSSLFQFTDVATPARLRRLTCHDPAEADDEAIEFIAHAHEELAGVSAANQRAFAPVASSLRNELTRRHSC